MNINDDKKVDILIMKYEGHCKGMQERTSIDVKFNVGYISINVLFIKFIFDFKPEQLSTKLSILFFVVMLGTLGIWYYIISANKRKNIIGVLNNINKALCFYHEGVYFSGVINHEDYRRSIPMLPFNIVTVVSFALFQSILIFWQQ